MNIEIQFDTKTVSKESLQVLIRGLEAEYCQVAIAIKMKEYNYDHLDLDGDQKEEDEKTKATLDEQVQKGKEAMEFHAKNIEYFKSILATYDK